MEKGQESISRIGISHSPLKQERVLLTLTRLTEIQTHSGIFLALSRPLKIFTMD